MLLKAERIISRDDILIDRSNEEIMRLANGELCRDIIGQMQAMDLLKLQVVQMENDDGRPIVKVVMTTRAYHPDA